MGSVLSRPANRKIFFRRFVSEIEQIGIDSVGIVSIVSVFMGAVLTIQMGINFESPIIPRYIIGLSTRDTMILEFSSTIVCLILAGRVGSNIASEIGTMRITEQIDALEIMGINSANYLILPKIVAAFVTFPFLALLSRILGIAGGFFIALTSSDIVTVADYIYGLHYCFVPFYVTYTLIKMVFFAVLITSISAFFGFYTEGGALEVGKSSTKAVVFSIIAVLLFNLILTQVMLT